MAMAQAFEQSFNDCAEYPTNLVWKEPSRYVINTIKDRLAKFDAPVVPGIPQSLRRVTCEDNEAQVAYYDIRRRVDANGTLEDLPVSSGRWISDVALRNYLIDRTRNNVAPAFRKVDPQCRFVFITANGNSQNPLTITKEMLTTLLTHHQVMPEYVDFLSVFGREERPRAMHFGAFRKQVALQQPVANLILPDIRRSGKAFQMCYNIKLVGTDEDHLDRLEPNAGLQRFLSPAKKVKTRVFRQMAVHHQMDFQYGTALWIFAHGRWDFTRRATDFLGNTGAAADRDFTTPQNAFVASLATHLMIAGWASEEWQPFLEELEDAIDDTTSMTLKIPEKPFTPDILMNIQWLEEKATEAKDHLNSNKERLRSLSDFYQQLIADVNFPLRTQCAANVTAFVTKAADMIETIGAQVARLSTLCSITSDRKTLVTQRLSDQSTRRMENMSEGMYKETVAMRVLAVITLIFLPATFSSTFFSTDVVKYQQQGNDNPGSSSTSSIQPPYMGSFSWVAMQRWLEVTLPLMLLTGIVAVGIWLRANVNWKDSKRKFEETLV